MTLKIGSLFSGYGGLDYAVEQFFNAETVWHCEWEDAPSRILEARYPNVPNYRDVSKVDWSQVEPVDILTGGFPCQDVSLAGSRRGLAEGTRSGLWSEFAKAIEVLKPRLVVIENVRGLLSASAGSDVEQCSWCMGEAGDSEPVLRALGAVLGSLADLGYDARWTGVRAADAGAPHNRFRVFIVAYPSGGREWGGALSPEMAKAKGQTLRLTGQIIDLVEPDRLPKPLFPTPNTMDHLPPRSVEKLAESRERSAGGYANVRETVVNDLLPTVTTQDGKNNGGPSQFERNTKPLNTQVLVDIEWGKFEPAIRRWEAVTGRKSPAPTEPDGKDGQHRLSSEFTEWMMGLDQGWVTGVGLLRNDELKACGNGVVPQQALLALSMLFDGVQLERERERVKFPTPTVSDVFTDKLASTQQKDGSMHSVTLPQAVRMVVE